MPVISVVIPAFNAQATIGDTINSVLRQSFSDFELIVIDASSTDATLAAVSQITDSRIKVFSYPQANVAVNRNRGFKHATGDFISFVDADDLWTPNKLEAQYKALVETDAGVAYSWTNCIDESGKFLRKCSHVNWTGDVYANFLLDDFIGSGSNVMIRRQAFKEVNGFDETLTNAQDTDLWLRLAALYNFIVVPEAQILYRIRANSMSSDILGLEKSNLTVIESAFAHDKAKQLQYLKRYSLGNLYKYLSYKALEANPGKQKNLHAIRFILTAVRNDSNLLLKPIFVKAILKLLVMMVLPAKIAQSIFNKFPQLANTSTFLGYEILQA
jgi:glycosyltransferase involved in cell wall biosynthesis